MLIPHGAYVLNVDGARMGLFRNKGRAGSIELEVVEERTLDNPRTHVVSEPQPGRAFQSSGPGRSAYETTDMHQQRENAFCESALETAIAVAGEAPELVLVAPPRAIGVLRNRIARHADRPPTREIVKDLAGLKASALSDHLRKLR